MTQPDIPPIDRATRDQLRLAALERAGQRSYDMQGGMTTQQLIQQQQHNGSSSDRKVAQ